MTVDEMNIVLESNHFKSYFKDLTEHPIFSFKDGFIGRNGDKLGKYEISMEGSDFRITILEVEGGLFADAYGNIILKIPEDDRFPITLKFKSGSNDILFEAIPVVDEDIEFR